MARELQSFRFIAVTSLMLMLPGAGTAFLCLIPGVVARVNDAVFPSIAMGLSVLVALVRLVACLGLWHADFWALPLSLAVSTASLALAVFWTVYWAGTVALVGVGYSLMMICWDVTVLVWLAAISMRRANS